MKTLIFSFFLLLYPLGLIAQQDTIVKKNGEVILCDIQKEDSIQVFVTYKKSGQFINASIPKSEIRYVKYAEKGSIQSELADNAALGMGIGFDYGGVGVNIIVYPQRNFGLFANLGYPLAGIAYGAGMKIRFLAKDKAGGMVPYLMGMYGYNTAYYIKNLESENKIFYGPSFGFGFDFMPRSRDRLYSSIAITIPIRSSEAKGYMDYIRDNYTVIEETKLWPIGITVGANYIIGREKKK